MFSFIDCFRRKKNTKLKRRQVGSSLTQHTLTIETANEAGIKEKAILTITAAEKASRSYRISSTVSNLQFSEAHRGDNKT